MVHKDLDSVLVVFFFFCLGLLCALGLPVIILCRNLSMFSVLWKGQCLAPQKTSYLHARSLLAMLGMAPHYRTSEPTLPQANTFCFYHFTEQEASQSPKTCCLLEKDLRAFFQKSNCSASSS